jgi:hypothetical protein
MNKYKNKIVKKKIVDRIIPVAWGRVVRKAARDSLNILEAIGSYVKKYSKEKLLIFLFTELEGLSSNPGGPAESCLLTSKVSISHDNVNNV